MNNCVDPLCEYFKDLTGTENLVQAFFVVAESNGEDVAEAVILELSKNLPERDTRIIIGLGKIGMELREEAEL